MKGYLFIDTCHDAEWIRCQHSFVCFMFVNMRLFFCNKSGLNINNSGLILPLWTNPIFPPFLNFQNNLLISLSVDKAIRRGQRNDQSLTFVWWQIHNFLNMVQWFDLNVFRYKWIFILEIFRDHRLFESYCYLLQLYVWHVIWYQDPLLILAVLKVLVFI